MLLYFLKHFFGQLSKLLLKHQLQKLRPEEYFSLMKLGCNPFQYQYLKSLAFLFCHFSFQLQQSNQPILPFRDAELKCARLHKTSNHKTKFRQLYIESVFRFLIRKLWIPIFELLLLKFRNSDLKLNQFVSNCANIQLR